MLKSTQLLKLLLCIIFLSIKSSMQMQSDIQKILDSNGLNVYTILPKRYHPLSDFYLAIKDNRSERKNIIVLLEFFQQTVAHFPKEIKRKILYTLLKTAYIISKIDYCNKPNEYGHSEFKNFTLYSIKKFEEPMFTNNTISIRPNKENFFLKFLEEIKSYCTNDSIKIEEELIEYIEEPLLKKFTLKAFCINYTDGNYILKKKFNSNWENIEQQLQEIFITSPSLLKKVYNAKKADSENILIDEEDIVLRINDLEKIVLNVNESTYKNFLNKVHPYNLTIKDILSENYFKNSNIKVTDSKTDNTLWESTINSIILNTLISPKNSILVVECINETIATHNDLIDFHCNSCKDWYDSNFSDCRSCKNHLPDAPNPTSHTIKLCDLFTGKLLHTIRLPLAKKYVFGEYNFSLYNIDQNHIFIYSKNQDKYISLEYKQINQDV